MLENSESYIHGFDQREQDRLIHQADFLAPLVYAGVDFGSVRNILEVGSGVGAQTQQLLKRYPLAHVTCIELSGTQLAKARLLLREPLNEGRVTLVHASAEKIPLADGSCDGAFICWMLEHVMNPHAVLTEVRRILKPQSAVFIREVFNLLWRVEPERKVLTQAWTQLNQAQLEMGGNPFVGARLGTLLKALDFSQIDIQFQSALFDRRDLIKRNEMLKYWCDLFLSGAANQTHHDEIELEFKLLAQDLDSYLYFGFAKACAERT